MIDTKQIMKECFDDAQLIVLGEENSEEREQTLRLVEEDKNFIALTTGSITPIAIELFIARLRKES